MKVIIKNIIVVFSFLLISCNKDQSIVENNNKNVTEWEILKIESRNQTITINKYEDYGVRDTCDFEKVRIDKYTIEYRPINKGQVYFNISKQEKDSLFKYIYDIVTNPVYTDQFATCYVGNISISFSLGNTTQICKYNSVGNWTTISLSTDKLYRLLSKKTKISEY